MVIAVPAVSTMPTSSNAYRPNTSADPRPRYAPFTVMQIMTEFHVSLSLRMTSLKDVEQIRFAGAFLADTGYRTLYFKEKGGYRLDRVPGAHPELVAAGLKRELCCYMYVFVRDDLVNATPHQMQGKQKRGLVVAGALA